MITPAGAPPNRVFLARRGNDVEVEVEVQGHSPAEEEIAILERPRSSTNGASGSGSRPGSRGIIASGNRGKWDISDRDNTVKQLSSKASSAQDRYDYNDYGNDSSRAGGDRAEVDYFKLAMGP